MTGRQMCIRAAIVLFGLLASALVVQVASPGAAQARCRGVNDPLTSALAIGGDTVVQEQPVSGTCNGNRTYRGRLRSLDAGFSAQVWIQDNGLWRLELESLGMAWREYEYADSNSHSLIHLCLVNHPDPDSQFPIPKTWWCGWGNDVRSYSSVGSIEHNRAYGVNDGF